MEGNYETRESMRKLIRVIRVIRSFFRLVRGLGSGTNPTFPAP